MVIQKDFVKFNENSCKNNHLFYKIIRISKKVKKIENRHHIIQKWCLLEFTKVQAEYYCLSYQHHPTQQNDITALKVVVMEDQTSHGYP